MKNLSTLEKLNTISHLIGAMIGILFLCLLLIFKGNTAVAIAGYSIYGACFIFLFSMSTVYHRVTLPPLKKFFRAFDHISIYLFIAGTYTPIIILGLKGSLRWLFLALIWAVAAAGMVFKIVSYGKYNKYKIFSVILYLLMGWLSVLIIAPLYQNTSLAFILWLVLGGVVYSAGTYFYKDTKHQYSHFVWHIFVLVAAIFHFIAIFILR